MTGRGQVLRPRTVVALVGGRVAYRLAMYGAGVVLLALWGAEEFAGYAAATGAFGWLLLASSGPEKAALALLPRAGGAGLERLFVWLAVTPFAATALGYVGLLVSARHDTVARYLAAAAVAAGVGCCAVLVGLYRVRGRPHADSLAYLAHSAGYGTVVALVATVGLTVDAVLAVLLALVAAVDVVLVVRLLLAGPAHSSPAQLGTARPSRPAVAAAVRASAVLGVHDLLGAASVSVLYAVLAVAADATQISEFYLLMIVSAGFSVGWGYLLRLAQPRLVNWLEQGEPTTGWRIAGRVSAWATTTGGTLTVALIALLTVRGGGGLVTFAALGLELALYATTATALLVLESTDRRGRRWSAGGAAAQFATVAVVGWWLVPVAGAAAAFGALCAGEVVKAAMVRQIARRVAAEPAGSPPSPPGSG